jgi:hypothetical protein
MSAGAFEPQFVLQDSIDQNPVRLDMAVSVSHPLTREGLILVFSWKRLAGVKKLDQGFELIDPLASSYLPLDVSLELPCLAELHLLQEA